MKGDSISYTFGSRKKLFFKETNPDKYLTQEVALQMWKECLGVDYLPTTDLRKVYYLDENGNKIINFTDGEGLKKAVEEASKYRKLFKNPCYQAGWNKNVPFSFS